REAQRPQADTASGVVISSDESEKIFGCFGRSAREIFDVDSARGRDRIRDQPSVRRLAAFSAERDRREIWAIGFHHELPGWNLRRELPDRRAIFESYNAGEGNEMVKIENFSRLFERTAETMEDAAQLLRIRPHNFERVFPRVALMDDDIEPEFRGQIQLLFKQAGLFRF